MKSQDNRNTFEADVQAALDETGFGMFNIKSVLLCGLIYFNTGFGISSVGFILPSAACDYQMNTVDKGRISAASMLGMMFGSLFWAIYADLKGRRTALIVAIFLYAALEIVSAFVPIYWCFVALKFFSGFAMSGQSALIFPYLGEFQPTRFRDRILCWAELAWTFGLIVLPFVAWAIIPLDVNYTGESFFFHSWNLFVLICSLPSVAIGIWVCFFPDTPKYLAESNQMAKLSQVLGRMYSENTGNSAEDYFETLRKTRPGAADILNLTGKNNDQASSKEAANASLGKMLRQICREGKNLFSAPYLWKTLHVCTLMGCVVSCYYTLLLWFPDLFQRYAQHDILHPGRKASICEIYQELQTDNATLAPMDDVIDCELEVQDDVFLHTLYLGLACLPLSVLLPFSVDWLGYKFYLVLCTLISAATGIALFFVGSSTENLILSCIFEALLSVCMSIVLCVTVDIFPTNLRALTTALAITMGRFGGIVSNTLFGYLISSYCIPLIGIIIAQLILSAILGCLLPPMKKNSASKSTVDQSHL